MAEFLIQCLTAQVLRSVWHMYMVLKPEEFNIDLLTIPVAVS